MHASRKIIFLAVLLCVLLSPYRIAGAQEPTPTSGVMVGPAPADIINAVNSTRLAYGLPPLAVHPALMQIAQEEANGIASGMPGHWRPNGITLGQWLIFLGYPLSGDLSLDGYRSENWVAAGSLEQAMGFWLSDASHTDTILSPFRSDMGVGVAVGDQIYMVIETALQTRSGQMQSDAAVFLTSIPMTQAAYYTNATLSAENGDVSQYVLPVSMNTALPNGDVYHEVQYGQTLWSIAVRYDTTIKQIQQLNNLQSTIVNVGQKLLVLTGTTPHAPSGAVILSTPVYEGAGVTMLPTINPPTHAVENFDPSAEKNESEGMIYGLAGIAISALILGGVFAAAARRKPV